MEVQELNVKLQMMKLLVNDVDEAVKQKMKEMNDELEVKRSELEELEKMNSALIEKYIQSNDEVQAARKELSEGLTGFLGAQTVIGIKKMGKLDMKPFLNICKKIYPAYEDTVEAYLLCSTWQKNLKDPSWHPFKSVGDTCDNVKEVVEEEDEKLKKLKVEWGEELHNAVKTALEELNEYNPSGRSPVAELWNFKEGRRATLKEVVTYILNHIKRLKRKRT